ncbi:MAG: putative transposable element tc3 transposase [Streblomastix strix]|uniref:Putative transposable element tc3 transposase n=1 Tax=Streblomastix strix TaxID=222440 RepID=A0A5J4VWG6_9EUKA|nr:MAG: putative transposable element tc3 transposase [Streblomastix strix]
MSRRPLQERIDVVLAMARVGNAREVARTMPGNMESNRKFASRTFDKFQETGSVLDEPRTGNVKTALDDNNVNDILADFDAQPTESYRDREKVLPASHSSLQRLAKREGLHSYRQQPIQELQERDYGKRHLFSLRMLEKIRNIPQFLDKIWFSDEAKFLLSGMTNFKNNYYLAKENPHFTTDKAHKKGGLMTWCAVSSVGLIGPIFISGSVDGWTYRSLICNEFLSELDAYYGGRSSWYFQQDGAPAHYEHNVRDLLDEEFPRRWIGRSGPIEWPPRSPDLTPLDYWLWGILRDGVYSPRPKTLEGLREAIIRECQKVTPAMCKKAIHSLNWRLESLRDSGGQQVEH